MDEKILLVDNGSVRAAATQSLRKTSAMLGVEIGRNVEPVSLLHSSKVPIEELGGKAARTLKPYLRKAYRAGDESFLIIPQFLGPSGALVDFLPQLVEDLRAEGLEGLRLRVAQPLMLADDGGRVIVSAMAERVRTTVSRSGLGVVSVALVDHGTPLAAVNEVRNWVAERLAEELAGEVACVAACSMESRDGEEYAFNRPLLEQLLGSTGFDGEVVLAPLFLAAGRHAGPGGDIAKICDQAEALNEGLKVVPTGVISEGADSLVKVLALRYLQAQAGELLCDV